MSVAQVQECTDAEEFAEWVVFQAIDPASEERADYRTAIIATVISNMFRGKRGKAVSPYDFMPYTERPKASPEKLAADIRAWGDMMMKQQAKRKATSG